MMYVAEALRGDVQDFFRNMVDEGDLDDASEEDGCRNMSSPTNTVGGSWGDV